MSARFEHSPDNLPNLSGLSPEHKESFRLEDLKKLYGKSAFFEALRSQQQGNPESPVTLLAADVDNTLVRKGKEQSTEELFDEAAKGHYPIAAVTGNTCSVIAGYISSGKLPRSPEILVGSVGTEIYVLQPDGRYQKDHVFEQTLKESGFAREQIVIQSRALIEEMKISDPTRNFDFQTYEQEHPTDEKSQPFKVSFYFYGGPQDMQKIAEKVSTLFPNQAIVACEEIGYNEAHPKESNKKYCLDILANTKGGAARYLRAVAGIEFEQIKIVGAGDSGNDLDLLEESDVGVAVGGSKQELMDDVERTTTKKKGRRSFRKVTDSAGVVQAVYVEQDVNRQAAESILRAAKILRRAENIRRLKGKGSS